MAKIGQISKICLKQQKFGPRNPWREGGKGALRTTSIDIGAPRCHYYSVLCVSRHQEHNHIVFVHAPHTLVMFAANAADAACSYNTKMYLPCCMACLCAPLRRFKRRTPCFAEIGCASLLSSLAVYANVSPAKPTLNAADSSFHRSNPEGPFFHEWSIKRKSSADVAHPHSHERFS